MSLYEPLHGGEHAYFDAALSLTFFLLIGRYLEHRTKSAARSAASELAALEVYIAQRKKGGRVEAVPISELNAGDLIVVHSGMRVPVDGRLQSSNAYTDRAFLTGESEPFHSAAGVDLSAGEINLAATFEMTATAIGEDTRLARIARLVETAEVARNSYTSLADKAARTYAPVVHLLAAVSFLGWLIYDGDVRNAVNVAIAVLIITCPCALGLAVPAVSTAAISRLYRLGFLVKSGMALERLASIKAMIFDKTGTLTAPGFSFESENLTKDQRAVAKALANSSSHPISKALAAYLSDTPAAELHDISEVPGCGVHAIWRGQPVALGKASWLGESGEELSLLIGETCQPLVCEQRILYGAAKLAPAFHAMEITTEIVSGDTEAKTASLARRIGVQNWRSAVSPENKADYVRQMAQSVPVCMAGDGINDTAALAYATVSVAPGSALDASRNAADVVMIGDTLGRLPEIVKVARKTAMRRNRTLRSQFCIIFSPFQSRSPDWRHRLLRPWRCRPHQSQFC